MDVTALLHHTYQIRITGMKLQTYYSTIVYGSGLSFLLFDGFLSVEESATSHYNTMLIFVSDTIP